MNLLKNIVIFFSLGLTLSSCREIKNDKAIIQKEEENKYTKIISDPTNKLTGKIESLEVSYTVWGCACPQWILTKDLNSNPGIESHFYLEPANDKLELPDYFLPYKHFLKIKGQFYERKDYPQGTVEMEEKLPKAKVFRYTEMKVIKNPAYKNE
ncbi:hypothetical protein NAT51_08550 [Flavobacterium amniphilum]|uniref:hypothetical protein n=1 Tax=Flavobacterium amniphilum TaxID=1834035 RepID=UPI00202A3F4A|nr:hypothetical protein [Flavobacterium amniphilum]MCL9805570.1 hypothetical protein [Flavobacterium amniphilum]